MSWRVPFVTLILLAAQQGLTELMARTGMVDELLAAGTHTPTTHLALAGLFLLVRCATLVLLPALLVATSVWLTWVASARRESPSRR